MSEGHPSELRTKGPESAVGLHAPADGAPHRGRGLAHNASHPAETDVQGPPPAIPLAFPSGVVSEEGSGEVALEVEGEGIYCPICNYNLTGIFCGRCPECGAFFNRRGLILSQASHKIILMPWDRPDDTPPLRRLRETLGVCLLNADRFAFAFSVQPQKSRVWSFFAWVLMACVVEALAMAALSLVSSPGSPIGTGLAARLFAGHVAFVLSLVALLTFTPAVVFWLTCTHFDGRRHFAPWMSICAYASAHLLLLGACLPFAALPMFMDLFSVAMLSIAIALGVVILWGCTLRAVIGLRRTKWDRNASPTFAVVLCGLGSLIVSILIAVLAVDRV